MNRNLLIYRGVLVCVLLALSILSPAVISDLYGTENSPIQLLYGLFFPALPFIVLCVLALVRTQGQFVFGIPAVVGAMLGAIAALALPWGLLWFSSALYRGGGANIGLGILWLLLPIYLPIAMVAGGWLGRTLHRSCWYGSAINKLTSTKSESSHTSDRSSRW